MKKLLGSSLRFLVVGGVSTLVEIGVFNLLYLVLDFGPVTSKVVASLVALVNAYFGNREWAFRHRANRARGPEVALFVGANLVCTALGATILGVANSVADHPVWLVLNIINLGSIAIIVFLRFALYHWVVFRPVQRRRQNRCRSP